MMAQSPMQLAVLGDPIEHSRSPTIHALFSQQAHIPVDYQAIRCSVEGLNDQLARLHAAGFKGLNLTVPLKEHALSVCQARSDTASDAGAVNTLVRTDTGWWGTNTDGVGLVKDIHTQGLTLRDQRILIIGAGGASAGIIGPLLAAGVATVAVLNRTLSRAQRLCERFNDPRLSAHPLDPNGPGPVHLGPFDGIIQASAQGHLGTFTLPRLDALAPRAWCYDLNYGPAHQPFRAWAMQADRWVVDGLGMLVEQAALSFEHWTGHRPDTADVVRALREQMNVA